jgi:hypothetical protein
VHLSPWVLRDHRLRPSEWTLPCHGYIGVRRARLPPPETESPPSPPLGESRQLASSVLFGLLGDRSTERPAPSSRGTRVVITDMITDVGINP